MNDARAGKKDKIVTKSISRFTRNIQTSINIARELKDIGVEIYFDNVLVRKDGLFVLEELKALNPENLI